MSYNRCLSDPYRSGWWATTTDRIKLDIHGKQMDSGQWTEKKRNGRKGEYGVREEFVAESLELTGEDRE